MDRDGDVVLKKVGRPNVLDDHLIRKVKNIAMGTRQAGGVINRKQILTLLKVLLGEIILAFWKSLVELWSIGERYSSQIKLDQTQENYT